MESMRRRTMCLRVIPLLLVAAMPVWLGAQISGSVDAPPKETSWSGCVTQIPNGEIYVLSTADACILLQGDFDAKRVANHVASLKGVLAEGQRKRLKVHSVEKIGAACTQTCKLPLMTRGLHGKELPGSNGGTAGEKPNTQPPPQQ